MSVNVVVRFFIELLEILFAVGLVGSVLVLVMSGVEDMRIILEDEEPAQAAAERGPSGGSD